MFKMLSDFFEKRREKELLARAAIAERDAAQVKRAQEMVNELSKIAGIKPPTAVLDKSKMGRYAFNSENNEILIAAPHASRSTDDELWAAMAHEIGHAQDGEMGESNKAQAAQMRSLGNRATMGLSVSFVAPIALIFSGLPPEKALLAAFVGAVGSALYGVSTTPAEFSKESRADQFAIEKAGVDPFLLRKAHEEFAKNGGINATRPPLMRQLGNLTGIHFKMARGESPYLRAACEDRFAGLGDVIPPPARIPSRFSRPPVIQEPEVTSTGRLVKPNARGPDRDYDAPEPAPEKRRGLVLQMKRDC